MVQWSDHVSPFRFWDRVRMFKEKVNALVELEAFSGTPNSTHWEIDMVG